MIANQKSDTDLFETLASFLFARDEAAFCKARLIR
jgi:hypothetical protein